MALRIPIRVLIPAAVFIVLVAVLAVGIEHSRDVGTIHSPLVGRPGPAWELPTLTDAGRKVGSSQLRGRWYLLNVWATWCFECRAEHDTLLQMQKVSPVPIVGMDWDDDDARALDYISRLGNPYEAIAADRDGHTAVDWGVYGAPETFLVDDQGRIVYKYVGPLTLEVWRTEFVSRLPANPAPSGS
ncbi:MAG TPA: DsbE family thiol:disulfide interchange protein [Steroidobacteraceae bacterium]|nr:DsbE family thiol:disulfide interchange protein [Steroidobacteraceae bacterium]